MRLVLVAACALSCCAASIDDQLFNGRWDITVNGPGSARGWCLEVSGAGTASLKGKMVGGAIAQLQDIPKLSIRDGELRFTLENRYRREHTLEKNIY